MLVAGKESVELFLSQEQSVAESGDCMHSHIGKHLHFGDTPEPAHFRSTFLAILCGRSTEGEMAGPFLGMLSSVTCSKA